MEENIIKLKQQESEAVERAYYDVCSYEKTMATLSKMLNKEANALTAEMLYHYTDLYQRAQMKLKMVQDRVLARYIDPMEHPNQIVHFDFIQEGIRINENEKV